MTLWTTVLKTWRAVAARPRCVWLNELLFHCALRGLGILNYEDDRVSGERHLLQRILPRYARSPGAPTCVDVGANCGSYAQRLLELNPGARVICLEPHPAHAAVLRKVLAGRGQVVPMAAGALEGDLVLYDRADAEPGSQHASVYREVISELHRQRPVAYPVKVVRLDRIAEELGLDAIDLLKVDTEGHEREVLRGCSGLLEQHRVRLIHIEFNEMNVVSRVFFRDLRALLPDHAPFRLLPAGMIPIGESPMSSELFAYQNVVFLPKPAG